MKARHGRDDLLHLRHAIKMPGFILRHGAVPAKRARKSWLGIESQNSFEFLAGKLLQGFVTMGKKVRHARAGKEAAQQLLVARCAVRKLLVDERAGHYL